MKTFRFWFATVLLVFLAVLLNATPCSAQHDDQPGDGEQPWVLDVHDDHESWCDNISGQDGGRDIDCFDRTPTSSREWETTCFEDGVHRECNAWAIVYCPGLGTGSSPGKDYIGFLCYASNGAEVRSGILEGFGNYPLKKGVYCKNSVTGASVSCGCIQSSTSSSTFFGNPQPFAYPNNYPNHYTCGSV